MEVPPELLHRAAEWKGLKRWERKELGQGLRKLGLAYFEIRKIIPVPKGTLSTWCRDIPLTPEQLARIRAVGGNGAAGRAKAGRVLRERRQAQVVAIRELGREEARGLAQDLDWMAGVVAYWGEGHKRSKEVGFTNSDPALVVLFVTWAKRFLDRSIEDFTLRVHYHAGQDQDELRAWWSSVTGIPKTGWREGFMKAEGSGHRKNVLYNGTVQIRVNRSADLLHRIFGWIDFIAGPYERPWIH